MNSPPPSSRSRHLVDPELMDLLSDWPITDLTPELVKAMRETALPIPPASAEIVARIDHEQRVIPGRPGDPEVRIEIYRPKSAAGPRPAILHVHGGGYVIGSAAEYAAPNMAIAAELDCIVVSVDYRLSPETAAPGAADDCYAALTWMASNAADLGIDITRIGIKGESSGGGLAAAVALLTRDRGEHALSFQHLVYPMLDDRTKDHPFAGEFIWTPHNNHFGWRALLGQEPGAARAPAYSAAARADRLAGLPPTFIAVGALDLFVEENIDYARRLIREGVPCELHVYPGAYHGFDLTPGARVSAAFRRDSIDAMRRAFAG